MNDAGEGLPTESTDWKRREADLLEREAVLRNVIDHLPAYVAVVDAETLVYRFVNQNYVRNFGKSREQILGAHIAEVIGEDRYVFALPYIERVRRGETTSYINVFSVAGGERHIQVNYSPGFDAAGRVRDILVLNHDVTELKRTEQELRESELRYRGLFELSPVGIGELHPLTGRFIRVNQRYCEIVGLSRDEMLTTDFQAITHPDDLAADLENMRRLLAGEIREFTMEKRYLKKGGTVVWVKLSVSPLWKHGETPDRHIAIVEDITEKKRGEEAIQRAQKMESLGLLAGGIAHDFNNMLAGFFNYIYLAKMHASDPKVVDYLAKASKAMDRARGLTRQLLTFAKGGEPVRRIEALAALIQDSARFAVSGSNVTLDFAIEDDLWPCRVDRSQIGQVIDNLVINARQAMPEGGRIGVAARNLAPGEPGHAALPAGPCVRITIADSGGGIPAENLERIFDPFFTTKVKGQGLGLATSYSIVQRHGGLLEVESSVGKGSAFHVTLPAEPGAEEGGPRLDVSAHRGVGTILLMDDEEALLDSTADLLAGFGYESLPTAHGQEAIDAFDSDSRGPRRIVAVILDLTIPGAMGGKEAAARLRERDGKIPIFVASGYAEDPVMARPEAYGFTASLGKPFKRSELERTLQRHLVKQP